MEHIAARCRAPGWGAVAREVEVVETAWGTKGLEPRGRQHGDKALVAVAVEGVSRRGLGGVRFRQIGGMPALSLQGCVAKAVGRGSVLHIDRWKSYNWLEKRGFTHRITCLRGRRKSPADLLPRVHCAVELPERWFLGTHQGAASIEHLDHYVDKSTFRFSPRTSQYRRKLFCPAAQQAVADDPALD